MTETEIEPRVLALKKHVVQIALNTGDTELISQAVQDLSSSIGPEQAELYKLQALENIQKKEKEAPLARTKNDFVGTPPNDMPDGIPHIDCFSDEELADYFLEKLFVQGQIGLNGEEFPNTTPENLEGIRKRTLASLSLDVAYAQQRGRPVPQIVLDHFKNCP